MENKHVLGWAICLLLACTAEAQKTMLWSNKANLLKEGRSLAVASINGKIYAVGGYDTDNQVHLATLDEYNPVPDTWSKKANMFAERFAPAAAAVNGKLYAIGGANSGIVATVEEYDPVTDTWTNKASMYQSRYAFSAVALNGKIYALGGQTDGDVPLASVEEYDPISNTWSAKADMPTPRVSFGAVALNGKIYVVGGRMNNTRIGAVYEYDPASNTWATKADIPTLRETLAVVVVQGKIWALGGIISGTDGCSTVQEYDPTSDTWRAIPNLPLSRNECYAFTTEAVPNTLYVFGGYGDSTMIARNITDADFILNNLQIYHPDASSNGGAGINLNFSTRTKTIYYIQSSSDLTRWTNYDGPFLGNATFFNKTYSTTNQNKLFFRLSAALLETW